MRLLLEACFEMCMGRNLVPKFLIRTPSTHNRRMAEIGIRDGHRYLKDAHFWAESGRLHAGKETYGICHQTL